MDNLKNFFLLISRLPPWLRYIIYCMVSILVTIYLIVSASSCSIVQSVNTSDNGSTSTMEVVPSQTTSTTSTLEIPLKN